MTKKSKVLNVNGNGTWESSYGLYYKWEVEFENGDAGQNLTKTEQNNYFVVGEEVEYIREEKGKFINIKRPKLDNFQSNNQSFKKDDNVQKMIVKQSSLKAATDFCISKGTNNAEDILAIAEVFTDWVMTDEKPLPFENKTPF